MEWIPDRRSRLRSAFSKPAGHLLREDLSRTDCARLEFENGINLLVARQLEFKDCLHSTISNTFSIFLPRHTSHQ